MHYMTSYLHIHAINSFFGLIADLSARVRIYCLEMHPYVHSYFSPALQLGLSIVLLLENVHVCA